MIDIEKLKQELTSDVQPDKATRRQSKKGVMRGLYQAICEKLDKGWRHADVAAWLTEKGVTMSVNMFSVYLYQLDMEHGRSRLTELAPTENESRQPEAQATKTAAAADQPAKQTKSATKEIGKEKQNEAAGKTEFPTSETTQQPAAAEPEGDELVWDNLAAELKVEPLDEKGFVQMPGSVKK